MRKEMKIVVVPIVCFCAAAAVAALSGSNTYSGGTFVEGGTLIVETPVSLADGSNLTVGNPLEFAAVTQASNGELGGSSPGVASVPEPTSVALLSGIAVAGLALRRFPRIRRAVLRFR